jgi:hypothetical protein
VAALTQNKIYKSMQNSAKDRIEIRNSSSWH